MGQASCPDGVELDVCRPFGSDEGASMLLIHHGLERPQDREGLSRLAYVGKHCVRLAAHLVRSALAIPGV